MTPDDLARVEARAAAATSGDWCYLTHEVYATFSDGKGIKVAGYVADEDGDFIAHARTDVPALVAALREAWAERDDLRRFCGEWATLEAERDDARAQLARVEALCDKYDKPLGPLPPSRVVSVSAIRAAITGPTPTEGDDA